MTLAMLAVNDMRLAQDIRAIMTAETRLEKEEALSTLASTSEGRQIINWCYNPFITFGVTARKEPEFDPSLTYSFNQFPVVDNLLKQLAARELTGNDAKEAVESAFASLNPAAGKILWLCLNKDLKAGVAEASIRSVDPSLIPTFAVMRAHTFEERLVKCFPVGVEPKLDGNRVSFIAKNGSGGFFTRTGKVIASLDHMVPGVLTALKGWFDQTVALEASDPLNAFISTLTSENGIPNLMLDGEMMSEEGFNKLNGALNRKDDVSGVVYNIFDCLSWEEFDAMGAVEVTYVQRRRRVNSVVQYASGIGLAHTIQQTPIRVCENVEQVMDAYSEFRAAGQEGAMVKDLKGFYEKKKSRLWLKIKNEDTEDLPVLGVFQGKVGGKYENTIGGLIVDRNGVKVRVPGLSDEMRAEIWSLWNATCEIKGECALVGYEGATFPMPETADILLGRLIEVEFHEETPDGSLRHPRFVRFRDDKTGEIEK